MYIYVQVLKIGLGQSSSKPIFVIFCLNLSLLVLATMPSLAQKDRGGGKGMHERETEEKQKQFKISQVHQSRSDHREFPIANLLLIRNHEQFQILQQAFKCRSNNPQKIVLQLLNNAYRIYKIWISPEVTHRNYKKIHEQVTRNLSRRTLYAAADHLLKSLMWFRECRTVVPSNPIFWW